MQFAMETALCKMCSRKEVNYGLAKYINRGTKGQNTYLTKYISYHAIFILANFESQLPAPPTTCNKKILCNIQLSIKNVCK